MSTALVVSGMKAAVIELDYICNIHVGDAPGEQL